ncbi:diguanylate cyclase [Sphingomonas trueperi]|uniref:GGDEF domain-containing protein n=1 Tax=Sphingomonas trueperi TaxID=53317 RepID=UPI003391B69C
MAPFRARKSKAAETDLIAQISEFLADQRLEATPENYALAYELITEPEGLIARAVHLITDTGVRITPTDVFTLMRDGTNTSTSGNDGPSVAAQAIAKVQMQVETFADLIFTLRTEAADFGRDLAESTKAMSQHAPPPTVEVVLRVTAAMLERVKVAEAKLDAAETEAQQLRCKLESARADARTDPLTKLPNRRAFEEAFEEAKPNRTSRAVAVCDIDRFKSVNDRFGHAVGDQVLRAVGETLTKACTPHLVARHGGEEFAILFIGTSLEEAYVLLNSARLSLQAKRYIMIDSDLPLGEITISAGLTTVVGDDDCRTAIGRADHLLYDAKEAGRNCVRFSLDDRI